MRGPLCLRELDEPNVLTHAFVQACVELGFGRNKVRGESHPGVSHALVTQSVARHLSAADAYLDRARGRHNLRVVTGAVVQRVVLDGDRATGVD